MIPDGYARYDQQKLPERVWVGKKEGEWPLWAFGTESQAMEWQAEHDTRVRRVWELTSCNTAVERIVEVPEVKPQWRS